MLPRKTLAALAAAALASAAVVLAVVLSAPQDGASRPGEPDRGPATAPSDVQPAPSTEREPGSATSYWDEERRRDASPG